MSLFSTSPTPHPTPASVPSRVSLSLTRARFLSQQTNLGFNGVSRQKSAALYHRGEGVAPISKIPPPPPSPSLSSPFFSPNPQRNLTPPAPLAVFLSNFIDPLPLLSNLRYRTRPRARKLPVVSRLKAPQGPRHKAPQGPRHKVPKGPRCTILDTLKQFRQPEPPINRSTTRTRTRPRTSGPGTRPYSRA